MIIILDYLNLKIEETDDFLLLSNLRDSDIEKITLNSEKFNVFDMKFIFKFHKKKYDIRLKNYSVIYYESAAYEKIKSYLTKNNNHLQNCLSLLELSLYLGYAKLSGLLLIFKYFLTQKKDLFLF